MVLIIELKSVYHPGFGMIVLVRLRKPYVCPAFRLRRVKPLFCLNELITSF